MFEGRLPLASGQVSGFLLFSLGCPRSRPSTPEISCLWNGTNTLESSGRWRETRVEACASARGRGRGKGGGGRGRERGRRICRGPPPCFHRPPSPAPTAPARSFPAPVPFIIQYCIDSFLLQPWRGSLLLPKDVRVIQYNTPGFTGFLLDVSLPARLNFDIDIYIRLFSLWKCLEGRLALALGQVSGFLYYYSPYGVPTLDPRLLRSPASGMERTHWSPQ